MEQQLRELEQKQRKLIFLFGEKLFELSRTQDVRFRYTFEGESEKKEVDRLLTLMNYLEDRIEKLDDAADEEEEVEEALEEEAVEEVEEVAEVEEPEGTFEVEEVEEAPKPRVKEPMITAVMLVEKAEEAPAVPVLTPEEAAEEVTVKVDNYEEDQIGRVVKEEVAIEEAVAVPHMPSRDALEDILHTGDFTSDADKRIFENNLKLLKSGEEREREIGIGQIAHLSSKAVLRRAYEFLLKDPSVRIRLSVIKSVTRMKDADAEGYFELGLADPEEAVRVAALKGLGTHVSPKNGAILERLLKDVNEHIRGLAVTYLGIYYGKDGVAKAVAAKADKSPYVRISLIEMVSIVKPEGSLRVVKELLSDKEDSVKKAAEKALGKVMPERKKDTKNGHKKS
ncbi:MAG: HEAT repeat domain-containing protein [Candidatus Omnitrophota bacterium]